MKKYLLIVPLATATCAPALSQSYVTIYGTIDVAVSRISATGAGHKSGVTSGTSFPSRLGFLGSEDLGGGLAASFVLEGSLTVDDGNAAGFRFDRRATLSLTSSTFGEIRLGRD